MNASKIFTIIISSHNMKRATTRRPVVVGIFVFLGLAIFVLTVFTLGGQQKTFNRAVMVRAIFDDVQGLQKGNNVWFSGVKIGTVKKISFYQSSQVEVDLSIEEKAQEYIRQDAKARISSEGFIGSKIIVIYGGTPKAPAVESGDMLAVEKTLGTDEIMSTLQTNNRNLLDITTDIKGITRRLSNGEGSAGKLLMGEALASDLNTVMNTLRRASANTERLTSTVAAYTAQLNKKGSLANALVEDTVLYARLKATAVQLDAVSKTTTGVVADLKQVSTNLNSATQDKNTPVGLLLQDQESAANMKAILKNLNIGSRRLNENLEALQHNFLLRGFFRKRAKQQAQTDSTSTP